MPSSPRLTRARLRRVIVLVSMAVMLTACSGGGKHSEQGSIPSSARTGNAARVTKLLTLGSADIQRAGTLGVVSRATRNAVLASAQRYVDRAVLAPLETGKVGGGYAALFVAGLRPAAIGPDAGALTDRAIGKTTTLNEQSTPVALSALLDKSGTPLYLATRFNVQVKATSASGDVSINRSVELTYEHVGTTWLVAAYRIKVTRRTPVRGARRGASPTHSSSAAAALPAGDAS